ncbi:GNAT family N-acetyltransferase [Aquabacterium sp.]|uniref:GNAT family N-acetyltransferase n=1 Tax=Aquabacterium sp. TaxID=1872578 RepID=UPI0019AED6F1|nr:GNAT family N-acetyltransferase [Aquabacterium sp.]MBC7700584.1 GNAT family N-acetyltransferase [Aquabacterium sp.]
MDAYIPSISLCMAQAPHDWEQAASILAEYGDSLGVDLSFQSFEHELADPAGMYGGGEEVFLLAVVDDAIAGCCALRSLLGASEANACEMKRLYVRPAFRGFGLGRLLVDALMQRARESGFSTMFVDTLSDMEAARELYGSLGFEPTEPYYFNPLPGAHYFRADMDGVVNRY